MSKERDTETGAAGSRGIDVSALDSISAWMLTVAGKSDEQLQNEERIRRMCLPTPLIPKDFNPDSLPDIANVPNILYTRPVWQASDLGGVQRRIRAEFVSSFHSLDQVRQTYRKNWLSAEDACMALSNLLERGECSMSDLRMEDVEMLGMTPDQFALFQQSHVCVTCTSNEMRELARNVFSTGDTGQ